MFISFFMSKRCRLTLPARPTRWRCARTCSGCCPRCPTSGPSSRPAQQHWCSVRRENVQIFFNRISSHLSPQHFLLLFKLNDVFPAIYNSVHFIRWQTRTQLNFNHLLGNNWDSPIPRKHMVFSNQQKQPLPTLIHSLAISPLKHHNNIITFRLNVCISLTT